MNERIKPDMEKKEILNTIFRTLNQEGHVLSRHPELLWQQLYNRLQWEGEDIQRILIRELDQRKKVGAKPWIRMKTKHTESKTLLRQLVIGEEIEDCDFSPNGALIICKSKSGFSVWDSVTGAEKAVPPNTQSLLDKSDITSYRRSIKNPDSKKRNPNIMYNSQNPYGISSENTTPKFFLDFMEGFLKISYSGPGRLTYKFWDLKNDNLRKSTVLWTPKYVDYGIEACSFSPDQRHAVTCFFGWNKTIIVWDLKTGRIKRRLNNHEYRITACAFNPDGRQIVTAGFDKVEGIWVLRIWDAFDGNCLKIFKGHSGDSLDEIKVCHFSPDGQKIISVGMNKTIYIWNSTEIAENTKNTSHGAEVTGCKFSPDGQRYITSGGKILNIYDTTSGNLLKSWNKGEMRGCFISPDNTRIAAILAESKPLNPYETDYSLCILDTQNGQKLNKIQGSEKLPIPQTAFGRPESPTRHLLYKCGGFSPDGRFIITAGFGNYATNLVLWEVESAKPLRTLEGYCNGAETLTLSKDGCFFGVATFSSNTADIWDVLSGKKTITFKGHETIVYNLGFSPDNARVVSGGADGKVKIWDRSSGEEIRTLIGHTADVRFCGFSPDGRKIISAGSDRTIRVWDKHGKQLTLLPMTHEIVIGDLHPTNPLAILGDEAGFVHLIELVGG